MSWDFFSVSVIVLCFGRMDTSPEILNAFALETKRNKFCLSLLFTGLSEPTVTMIILLTFL